MLRSGRKNVSLCAAIPVLPGCPGSAVPLVWPAPRRKTFGSSPSKTMTDMPTLGISRRPSTAPLAGFTMAGASKGCKFATAFGAARVALVYVSKRLASIRSYMYPSNQK